MVDLGVATIHFQYPEVSDEELQSLGLELFDVVEGIAREFVRLESVSVILTIEEGSLRARTKIVAGAIAVGTFLGNYGDIREGSEYLARDVMAAGRVIVQTVPQVLGIGKNEVITTRRSPTLNRRIKAITRKVERGDLSASDAAVKIIELIDSENEEALPSDAIEALWNDLSKREGRTRRAGHGEKFGQSVITEFGEAGGEPEPERLPQPFNPPHEARKIEVFREEKTGRKKVRSVG